MIGTQRWCEKDSTSSFLTKWIGHQWAIAGFIARFGKEFRCFPLISRLLSGQSRPFEFCVKKAGEAQPIGRIQSILSMIYQVTFAMPDKPLQVVADAFQTHLLSILFVRGASLWSLDSAAMPLDSMTRFIAVGDGGQYGGRNGNWLPSLTTSLPGWNRSLSMGKRSQFAMSVECYGSEKSKFASRSSLLLLIHPLYFCLARIRLKAPNKSSKFMPPDSQ